MGKKFKESSEDQLAILIGAYPERITLKGARSSFRVAANLGVLISQFATNAAKTRGLSSVQGKLAVQWRVVINGSRLLHIRWTESGMASLTIPDKIGGRTQLLAGAVQNCMRVFDTAGMECTFELNLESKHVNLVFDFQRAVIR
jgi:two-component sensor histidine kinase